MFNFDNLICIVSDSYSFVGIAKEGDRLQLHLPRGFEDELSELDTFESKRDFFFLLYRVLREFKSICIEKKYLDSFDELVTRDRDGVVQGEGGATTTRNLEEQLIFYAKLDHVDALLDAYDELKIAALAYRLGNTDQIDLSQLHRYLNRGVFLPNGAVYIDSMVLPRQQVQFEPTDIVALYCYLVQQVKAQLEDEISPEVRALAERFQQHYLGTEDSLFVEQSFEQVIEMLKDALETIDQRTPFKDSDYDQFYEAIEQFLYGNWQYADDGEIWGISNFHSVWESMCLTYLAQSVSAQSLLFLDRKFVSNSLLHTVDIASKLVDLKNTFICNGRELVPDAVTLPSFDVSTSTSPNYLLSASSWDDFSYRTKTYCRNGMISRSVCIAYIGQPTGHHSIEELKLTFGIEMGNVLVNSLLPEKFYSYWSFYREEDYEDIDGLTKNLQTMQYLNHIFYVAIRQGYWTFELFKRKMLPKLGVDERLFGNNVFGLSMFRSFSLNDIEQGFKSFVSTVLQFCVIDVKYLNIDYLNDKNNIAAIKERSIRKQFVYEYLLQQQVDKLAPKSTPQIDSHFWIPAVNSAQPTLLEAPKYLGGYLKLISVDLPTVMRHYVETQT